MKFSKMSQFLGYDSTGPILNVQAKDQASLNELVSLYTASKSIYYEVRQNTFTYQDCGPEAIVGEYKSDKHIITQHIHPIVAMLFLPAVKAITDTMLRPNIGRMVLARAPLVASKINLYESIMPNDIESEFRLGYAIAQDPNSTNVFSEETPMDNLTKRFQCQIELWRNVLSLRNGRYYANVYEPTGNSSVSNFMRVLEGYNKIHYDVVDNFNTQDEGNILKKILSIFSMRPTYASIYTNDTKIQIGYGNMMGGVQRTSFINMPVVNIRLPTSNMPGGTIGIAPAMHLRHALSQTDVFLKNRQLVPMNKSIVSTDSMIFFYAHSRQRTINNIQTNVGFRNIVMSPSFIGTTSLNRTPLNFNLAETIGRKVYKIRGVIVHETTIDQTTITGCSASIVVPVDIPRGIMRERYLSYNPGASGIMFRSPTGTSFVNNKPICTIPERTYGSAPGFRNTASTHGCIFWYVE